MAMTGDPSPAGLPYAVPAAPGVAGTPKEPPHYVGFWLRFVAWWIDNIWIILLLVPFLGMLLPGGEKSGSDAGKDAEKMQKIWAQFQDTLNGNPPDMDNLEGMGDLSIDFGSMTTPLVIFLCIIVVYALWWWLTGTTPGKWLVRAKVVDAVTLKPPSFVRSMVRSLAYYVSLLPFGLGFIWIAVDAKKRGFHDFMAGTVVIRKPGWFGKGDPGT